MPRRKVRPEDRLRVAKACLPCKASKKRCDATTPCSNCVRKKTASACVYDRSQPQTPGLPAATRNRRRSSVGSVVVTPDNVKSFLRSGQAQQQRQPTSTTEKDHVGIISIDKQPPQTIPPKPSSGRLLSNSRGEKGKSLSVCMSTILTAVVYVGGTASLSFLQFLRRTIRHQMGPSVFTENSRRHTMLEVKSPQDTSVDNFEADLCQKRAFIDVYFTAVREPF